MAKAGPRVEIDENQAGHLALEGERQAELCDLFAHGGQVVAPHGNVMEARSDRGVPRQERQVVVKIARDRLDQLELQPAGQPSAALTLDSFTPSASSASCPARTRSSRRRRSGR